MHFASFEFILFLIILVVLYYLIPRKWQWVLLLAASYVFYSFAGVGNFAYILITTITTWLVAIKMDKMRQHQSDYLARMKKEMSREDRKAYKAEIKARQRKWLIACLVVNFGILAVLKYAGYFQISSSLGLVLPLGISFYTFQSMGYLIDVYRGTYESEKNLAKLALFISFFPQLIQGPISRFNQLKETLFAEHTFDSKNISYGLMRILWGFFKKLVIADRLFYAVSTIISSPNEYQGAYILAGMFFYAIELYADFTGGIDIAIGSAQLLGIRLNENFQLPYFSKSIAEYWRRWHITLGTWFKDYLFYPISVSKTMLNLSKKARKTLGDGVAKRLPIYIASIIVWFTTGVWHGSSWNFIVWGLMNCFVILVSQECVPLYNKFHERFPEAGRTGWYRLFQVVRTFWLMSFIRTLDLYPQVGTTFRLYASVFTVWNLPELFQGGLMQLGLTGADYIVLAAAVGLMLFVSLKSRSESFLEKVSSRPIVVRYATYFAIFVFILIFGAYGIGYDSNQFIYSRF
ncbi:MAG: MBOAT family O-acyltransferase [Caldicoprobacterales bacterium]|jgi:alginate O-acetyltransferase complex protein AlgI|nr:MBOAT family protein [Clostridiales bacterium]